MNGQRALEVLASFTTGQLAFTAPEIEELLGFGLVLEANPADFQMLQWLEPTVLQYAETQLEDLAAPNALAARLAKLDEKLKSDWYRFTTSDGKLEAMEQERRLVRRALAVVNDRTLLDRVVKVRDDARRQLPPGGAKYLQCAQLGDELYALTSKGARVHQQLALRLERYKDYPLAAFMKAFDKTETKMAAFSGEIAKLSSNIGFVKKNPHQVVIGLAKTGVPAEQAIDTYRRSLGAAGAPDVAVTYARNAAALGGTMHVASKLQAAQGALYKAGFPQTPAVAGAAKTLIGFEPLVAGVHRFCELASTLERQQAFQVRGDVTVKLAARLMPTEGAPADVVARVVATYQMLRQVPSEAYAIRDERVVAVALASMVRDASGIQQLVMRFRELEKELVQRRLSEPHSVDADALECVGCPGTPAEVAETVRALAAQVAAQQGRAPERADIAVAAAFAKRFAY